MELDLNKLPEKDYFTIEEIADQWKIGSEQILYYVFEQKTLRLAAQINTSESVILKTCAVETSKRIAIADQFYYSVENSNQLTGKVFGFYCNQLFDYYAIDKSDIQKAHPFLYLDVDSVIDVRLDGFDEDAREREFYSAFDLASIASKLLLHTTNADISPGFPLLVTQFRTEANTLCYLINIDTRDLDHEQNLRPFFVSLLVEDFKLITKKERDRFLIEHGVLNRPESETPKERQTRLKKWYDEECKQNGKYGANSRTAKREGIKRQTLTNILNRK